MKTILLISTLLFCAIPALSQDQRPDLDEILAGMEKILKCYQPSIEPGRIESSRSIEVYKSKENAESMLAVFTFSQYPSTQRLKTDKTQIPLLVKKTQFNAQQVQQSQDSQTHELLRALNLSVYDITNIDLYELSTVAVQPQRLTLVQITSRRGIVYTIDMSNFPFYILCA